MSDEQGEKKISLTLFTRLHFIHFRKLLELPRTQWNHVLLSGPQHHQGFSVELLPSQVLLSPYYCRVLSLSQVQDVTFGALLAHELSDRTVLPAVKLPLNGILGHSSGHLNIATSTNKLRVASSSSQIHGLNCPGLSSVPCAGPQCSSMSHWTPAGV